MADAEAVEMEQGIDPAIVAGADSAGAGDPPAEPVGDTPAPPVIEAKTPAWTLKRISEESTARRQAEERLAAAERRAQEAEALAERLRTGQQQPPAGDRPAATTRTSEDDPAARRAEIAREAAAMRFHEDTVEVKNRGMAAYGQAFAQSLGILHAVGATSDDFVADVLAVDKSNAHELLERLAQEPEKAASLTEMSSRQRIAELTRMTMPAPKPSESALTPATPASEAAPSGKAAVAAPAARATSRAPAPPPPITPSAAKTVDWRSDKVSDADFSKGWEENMAKRHARR